MYRQPTKMEQTMEHLQLEAVVHYDLAEIIAMKQKMDASLKEIKEDIRRYEEMNASQEWMIAEMGAWPTEMRA
jgi:hypothetical protein